MNIKTDLSMKGKKIVERSLKEYADRRDKRIKSLKDKNNTKEFIQLNFPTMIPPRESIVRRIYLWFGKTMITPNKIKRWFQWWFIFPLQIELFVTTIFSGRVSKEEYLERENVCWHCPQNTLLLIKKGDGFRSENYCKSCSCWMWKPAQLKYKNWYKGWYCPQKKHEGTYPGDKAREYIKQYNIKQGGNDLKIKPKSCCGAGV